MGRQVFLFELDGKKVTGFDTGLDARAFARAKLAQLLTEPGLIVSPGNRENPAGSVELWKTSGVIEYSEPEREGPNLTAASPTMVVWGPAFEGERLDLPVNDSSRRDEALSAVVLWLKAVTTLDEKTRMAIPVWPCAALVANADNTGAETGGGTPRVFFAPPSLALRCLRAGDEALYFSGYEWYSHPNFGSAELVQSHNNEAILPEHLAWRSSGSGSGPGQAGLEADIAKANKRAAFTAATMLYRIFAGTPPFPATNDILIHQDMREGNFLPVRLAVPGLDGKLAELIQRVLEPHERRNAVTGTLMEKPLPGELLAAIQPPPRSEPALEPPPGGVETSTHTGLAASVSSLIRPVSETDRLSLEKEKKQFLRVKTASVNTKRFVKRNTGILVACLIGIGVLSFFVHAMVQSRAARPTTEGMEPIEVIKSYYNAFGELDHILMESMLMRGVGRNDLNMVTHLFVINRVRMAHEHSPRSLIISAQEWQERQRRQELETPYDILDVMEILDLLLPRNFAVFGVTDLQIEPLETRITPTANRRRNNDDDEVHFRVDYRLWVPAQMAGGSGATPDTRAETETFEQPPPVYFRHTDIVSLARNRRGNWQISDISRMRH